MILIPLIYGDHLPAFQWRSVTVGPQVRPLEPAPVKTNATGGPARPDFGHPPRVWNPIAATKNTPTAASHATDIELPSMLPGGDGPAMAMNPIGDVGARTVVAGPPPTPTVRRDPPPSGPIRVSQGVQMAKLIRQVMPIYPPMAKLGHVSGTVHLLGIIAKDGTIRNLQVIDGNPLLVKAAVDAVSQWVYRPTLLSGEPVEVICPIDVNFTLSH
jgi:periplasmic protein TonB